MGRQELLQRLKGHKWTDAEAHKVAFESFISGLDKQLDMASDLMKAMFSGTVKVTPKTGEVTREVARLLASIKGDMTRRELQARLELRAEENFR